MRASVIKRFAKNITVGEQVARDTSWTRRLATTVPLVAIVAVGAVGCSGGAEHGSAAAAPTKAAAVAPTGSTPSTPEPTSPAPTTPTTPAPAAPTTAPTTAAKPAQAPVRPASATDPGKEVAIRIDGLAEGEKLAAGGAPTTFSVTFSNVSDHALAGLAPSVSTAPFAGARCQLIQGQAQGTLQRKDGDSWTDVVLSEGTGMDYTQAGKDVAFALAPGAGRTIQYRLALSADNGPAPLTLDARAFAADRNFALYGLLDRHLTVVDPHRPTASMPTMTPIPTSVTVGGPAVQIEDSPGNFTAAPFTSLAPLLTFAPSAGRLRPQDLTVEAQVAGGWRKLAVQQDCAGELTVDTSSLAQPLENGQYGRVTNYLFRFSAAPSLDPAVTSLTVSTGALADGHYAGPVGTQVAVHRQG
ncbi:hypothetical protein [Kitasatospora azatica]|uniref:hypothetical protein n=1 Tax=Kitasatospora azatica TaxID=58347 RepID=UPI00056992D2|nr:hypothetical protein [Kitasatospora azatica]